MKQTGDFHLPIVPPDRSQLLRDSLKGDLAFKTGDAVSLIARDSIVRDSLLNAKAAPSPKKKQNTKERAAAKLVAAQRDSAIGAIEARRLDILAQLKRDSVVHDSILPLLLTTDSLTRYRANRAFRLALHSVSDQIEEWLTGTRGISATRIAYVQGKNLHVIDSDGAIDEIIRTPGAAMSPAWHPSGRSIVYSDFTDSGTQIAQVDLIADSVHMVAATPRGLNITPVYSPDGREIVYGAGGERPAGLHVHHELLGAL